MKRYFVLVSLTIISCSKGDDDNISAANNLPNNDVVFVNSGNIYYENNTCKCPDASNGDKDIISGVTYTAVNNLSIKEEISNGNYNLCTTLVTNMSGESISGVFQNFFNNNSFNSTLVFGMFLMLLIWMECFIMLTSSIKIFLTGIHQK